MIIEHRYRKPTHVTERQRLFRRACGLQIEHGGQNILRDGKFAFSCADYPSKDYMDDVLSMSKKSHTPQMTLDQILKKAYEDDVKRKYRRAFGYRLSTDDQSLWDDRNRFIHSTDQYPSLEQMQKMMKMTALERAAVSESFIFNRLQKQREKYLQICREEQEKIDLWWATHISKCMAFLDL